MTVAGCTWKERRTSKLAQTWKDWHRIGKLLMEEQLSYASTIYDVLWHSIIIANELGCEYQRYLDSYHLLETDQTPCQNNPAHHVQYHVWPKSNHHHHFQPQQSSCSSNTFFVMSNYSYGHCATQKQPSTETAVTAVLLLLYPNRLTQTQPSKYCFAQEISSPTSTLLKSDIRPE